MPTRKTAPTTTRATLRKPSARGTPPATVGTVTSTVSGPSSTALGEREARMLDTPDQQRLALRQAGAQAFGAAMPANPLKAAEHGAAAGREPLAGMAQPPIDPVVGSSTVQEHLVSPKVGRQALPGHNPTNDALDRVRVDDSGRELTTNHGVRIGDNQNSLKAGLRGPSLLEDFILREKITHFDHERIPERVVHARGSAAHGYFECYQALDDITMAAPFQAAGKRTPVFVRFSTVAGERGSTDTARDVRGFAVKFYTDAGNWDLVGNNIPVFFIQDAMKFPDLVHALKPEPHHQMPQASSAHDTFWDFVSLMPESAHMLLWVMSDRAIPRSYRMMQGFGVHTFRLVNAAGDSVLCKFHWTPLLGTHSLVWDEAVKISGADPDFHRRDLWEAIEAGAFPEYELGLQIFSDADADRFPFDVLDPTKIVPEELVPVRPVGRLVLNRNPDNFFAETEQVAFCTAHIVPGIDFTADPLLQGRIHSYVDTQLTRLGGPNFHEIPINSPIAQVHNNQRDGLHRQAIARGRVNYEPNSLGGGCPFQAGRAGFVSFPEAVRQEKLRAKPEKFADHYSQATLFYRSQTPTEQAHIAAAFRFELSRVQVPAVRERVLSVLANVDTGLVQQVADGLGLPVPAPQERALAKRLPRPTVDRSPALSLLARPGEPDIRGRRVALLVAEGADAAPLRAVHAALAQAGAVPRWVGARLGAVTAADGSPLHVEISLEAGPSALWDAVVLPGGEASTALSLLGQALEFIRDQYRHCKTILAFGRGGSLLEAAGIPYTLPDGSADPGLLLDPEDPPAAFAAALAKHKHYTRETDPPRV